MQRARRLARDDKAGKRFRRQLGFTLIEILVVMAIIGIIAVLGVGSYRSSQIKGKDAQRKSDLKQIASSLEIYFNDVGQYPVSSGNKIQGCGGGATVCDWGEAFLDDNGTVYMAQLPSDPRSNYTYYYYSNGTSFQIYTRLENLLDLDVPKDASEDPQSYSGVSCGIGDCNYGVSSPNTTPGSGRTLVTE